MRPPINLDEKHGRAICEEIGQRLRLHLSDGYPELPENLQRLLDRIDDDDNASAPQSR